MTCGIIATRLCIVLTSLLNGSECSAYHCVLWYRETRSAPIRQSENIVGTFQEQCCAFVTVNIIFNIPNDSNHLGQYRCPSFSIYIKTEFFFIFFHFFVDRSGKSFRVSIVKTKNETKTRTTPGYPTRKDRDIKQKWGCKCHPANPRAGQRRSLGLLPFEHMARTTKH